MINVVYLVSDLRPSGPTNQALNLVSSFNKAEVNAIVVAIFDEKDASWAHKFHERNVRVVRLHVKSRFCLLMASLRLRKIIHENQIHIVHSSGISANIVSILAGYKVKRISTHRSCIADVNERSNWLKRLISRALYRWLMNLLDVNVCCSQSLSLDIGRELQRTFPYVQNGADIDHYVPIAASNKDEMRTQLCLPLDKKIFVSVGVIEDRKNISLLVDAFKQLNRNDIYLVIVGWGPEASVENLKLRIGNNDKIRLVGAVSDPLSYYQCADYFISASYAEGLPNTVLEAMSCGIPVVLSDIGPHREMLRYDAETGCIFNHYDLNSCKEAIETALSWDIHSKSYKARALIEGYLSKYCTAQKYTQLYQEILYVV